jgi:precorrin-6Y C5,15-methyltransferase (decarboxylating)
MSPDDGSAWLKVVGIGEDGLAGLSPAAREAVDGAAILVGGPRHQAFVPDFSGERMTWTDGIAGAVEGIAARKGENVVVLASGDPLDYGIGTVLARRFDPAELEVFPTPGAFALACARMKWPRPDTVCLTVHGRKLDRVRRHLAPGRNLLILAWDRASAAVLAALLTEAGYGPSRMTVLEHLGGPMENRLDGPAEAWPHERTADLCTIAVACVAAPGTVSLSAAPGLADDTYRHDGQITKREVRAVTLAVLAPVAGEMLWDVGAGSGSIAIEWLRAEPRARAVAIERDPARAAIIAANAAKLGVPELEIVTEAAPQAFDRLENPPDAIFAGGGFSRTSLLEECWARLKPGGRLAANAVTLEAEARLLAFHAERGGDLARIEIARPKPVGGLTRWQPLAPVTQYRGRKA